MKLCVFLCSRYTASCVVDTQEMHCVQIERVKGCLKFDILLCDIFACKYGKEWKDLKFSSLLTELCASTSSRRVTELAKVPCRIAFLRDHLGEGRIRTRVLSARSPPL